MAMNRRQWLAAGGTTLLAAGISSSARAQTAITPLVEPVRLNLNENAYGPSPHVADAIRSNIVGIERYVDQSEVDRLAQQIARIEGVAPTQVVIGEVLEPLGLYLAQQKRGGNVVYSAPGYTALVDAGSALGSVGKPVPLNARLENDLPALLSSIDDTTLAVNLVNPHNPSGTVNDAAQFDAFILSAAAKTLVVVDEAYLEYDDFAQRSAIRHVRAGANVLVFRTLAKIYGLAGLSIGYAIAQAPLAQSLRAAGIGAPHSFSRLSLVAASAALADQAHVDRIRRANLEGRQRIVEVLDQLGLRHTESHANFVYFQTPREAALRAEAEHRHITIARSFAPLNDWVRITVGTGADVEATLALLISVHG